MIGSKHDNSLCKLIDIKVLKSVIDGSIYIEYTNDYKIEINKERQCVCFIRKDNDSNS